MLVCACVGFVYACIFVCLCLFIHVCQYVRVCFFLVRQGFWPYYCALVLIHMYDILVIMHQVRHVVVVQVCHAGRGICRLTSGGAAAAVQL